MTLTKPLSTPDIEIFQATDAGVKAENQDCIGARMPTGQLLAAKGIAVVIADGVSAAEAAQEASQACVTGFLNDYFSTPDSWSVKQSAAKVLHSLNRWLYGQSQSHIQGRGFLTTFSALIIKSSTAYLFHVGDSRIYRLRQGVLEQLTDDHSRHMSGSQYYLARAMGADLSLDVDYSTIDVQANDQFLLTTDGIHDVLSRKILQTILMSPSTIPVQQRLMDAALAAGSSDNLSCQHVVVHQLNLATDQESYVALKELPFPPDMNPGNSIDQLRVEKLIHHSERSQLYLVRDADNQLLVMKTPSQNYSDDSAYIERFLMEEWIGLRVSNVHLVQTVRPQPRQFLYYLTRYIDGPTLEQLLAERGQLDLDDAITLTEQLAKGLRALHRKETLHQDLKPANVKVSSQGAVILDFGSCHVAGINEIATPFHRETALGTAEYSAPEYRFGGHCNERSDQFSLALLCYEMLTGKHPYGERYVQAQGLKDFQALKYSSASLHNPKVPIWLDGALKKALSIRNESRYSAMSEFIHDLYKPNPAFRQLKQLPLLEQKPLMVWRSLCALSLLVNLYLAYLLLR